MGPNGASAVKAKTPALRVRLGANTALKRMTRLEIKAVHRFVTFFYIVVTNDLRVPIYIR